MTLAAYIAMTRIGTAMNMSRLPSPASASLSSSSCVGSVEREVCRCLSCGCMVHRATRPRTMPEHIQHCVVPYNASHVLYVSVVPCNASHVLYVSVVPCNASHVLYVSVVPCNASHVLYVSVVPCNASHVLYVSVVPCNASHVLYVSVVPCVLTQSACLVYHTQMVMSSDAVTKR